MKGKKLTDKQTQEILNNIGRSFQKSPVISKLISDVLDKE